MEDVTRQLGKAALASFVAYTLWVELYAQILVLLGVLPPDFLIAMRTSDMVFLFSIYLTLGVICVGGLSIVWLVMSLFPLRSRLLRESIYVLLWVLGGVGLCELRVPSTQMPWQGWLTMLLFFSIPPVLTVVGLRAMEWHRQWNEVQE